MMISLVLLVLVHPPTTGEDDAEVARSDDEAQTPEIQILITREDTLVHIDGDEET